MEGTNEIDNLMWPVLVAIKRHVKNNNAVTEIYNRAYEAVMAGVDINGDKLKKLEAIDDFLNDNPREKESVSELEKSMKDYGIKTQDIGV